MLKNRKTKQKTLSEKVTELIAQPNQSDSESENDFATLPRVVDYDEEEYQMPERQTTEFRKRNVKLLSEQSSKYKGKISSRKEIEDEYESDEDEDEDEYESEEDDNVSEEDSEDELAMGQQSLKLRQQNSEEDSDEEGREDEENGDGYEDSDEEDVDDEEKDDEEEDYDDDDDEADEDSEVMKNNQEAEVQKGICVQNQLRIWERLLELRIHSQKLLSKANQLPAPQEYKIQQNENENLKEIRNETTQQCTKLLKNLLTLQDSLTGQFSELKTAMKSSRKRPCPIKEPFSDEPPLKRIENHIQSHYEEFQNYRNTVLLKWDDRTKLLTPGAGAKKKSLNDDYDIIKKIHSAMLNKSAMIEKTQLVKNDNAAKDAIIGDQENATSSLNVNIYDDSDFYHQQLRELIEYKANTSTNMSEVTKQFVELQKLRQKMKKKVDTRASKGRKLRYIVHNKLVNFMAPHDNLSWTNESKDELSKSLFV